MEEGKHEPSKTEGGIGKEMNSLRMKSLRRNTALLIFLILAH
jgi:hypothetical protein